MAESLNLAGKPFAGYTIEKKIGAGGMGVVFRAKDERLGRTVAIKLLPPNLLRDNDTRLRFLREGRTAAKVDHGNVVRLLAAGEEDSWPYLVMEFVDGGSLQGRLDRYKRFPASEVIAIARQVAAGLGAAHRVGVLHRDVKPANVLFTREGEAKIADFGLAREESGDMNLSMTGMVMGTPHYMAPEVCEGRKADPRSDLYALGVMMYQMASGNYPFDGDAVMQLLMKHVQEVAPPLEGVPAGLVEIVDILMAKDPAARFQTADELIAALDAAAADPSAPASGSRAVVRPPSTPLPATQVADASGVRRSGIVPPGGSSASSIPATQLPPLSIAAPLPAPRWHHAAYGVAAAAVLASFVLLVWLIARSGSGGDTRRGSGTATGRNDHVEQPVDPAVIRRGEDLRRWAVFKARVLDPRTDLVAALAEVEVFAAVDPEGVRSLRGDLLERLKAQMSEAIRAREAELLTLAESDPGLATLQARNRGDWAAWPFASELRELEAQGERRVWDIILRKSLVASDQLLVSGDYRAALEIWTKLSVPADLTARRQSEMSSIQAAAQRAAQDAVEKAPRGPEGAKALRALAAKVPKEIADNLEARAFVLESAGANLDPLVDLAGFFVSRDFPGLLEQVRHLEEVAATSRLTPAQLRRVRRVAESSRRALKSAMDGYRARLDAMITVKLARGGEMTGTLFEVNDDDSGITLVARGGHTRLPAEGLALRELAFSALRNDRSNAACRDLADLAIGCRDLEVLLLTARLLLRRGVTPEADVLSTIAEWTPAEVHESVRASLRRIGDSLAAGTPDAVRARALLSESRLLLLREEDRTAAELALTFGEGTISPEDIDLLLESEITVAVDRSVTATWTDDSLLSDVSPAYGTYQADLGPEGLVLRAAGGVTALVVTGLQYRNVTLRLEVRLEEGAWVTPVTGWRGQGEGLPVFIGTEGDRVSWVSPTREEPGVAPLPDTRWITVEISVQDSTHSLTVNGVTARGPLLAAWPGRTALLFTGGVTIRKFALSGKVERVASGEDARMRELMAHLAEGGESAVLPGSWRKPPTKAESADLQADATPQFLAPARWSHGDAWVVRFKARLSGAGTSSAWPEVVIDARAAAALRKRFYLSGKSRCGFVQGTQWSSAGICGELGEGEEHEIALVADGDWGMVAVDERPVWIGHWGPAKSGKVELGVRNGTLTISNLRMRAIRR